MKPYKEKCCLNCWNILSSKENLIKARIPRITEECALSIEMPITEEEISSALKETGQKSRPRWVYDTLLEKLQRNFDSEIM